MLKVSEIYTSVDTVCIGKGYYQYNNRVLIQQKGVTLMSNSFLLWCHQESNRGHKDFQSFALPTELWHQHCVA